MSVGFKWVRNIQFNVAVVMDGVGQMVPIDLPDPSDLLDLIIENRSDHCKGNRFMTGHAYAVMLKNRFSGNAALSLLTKIALRFWHTADSHSFKVCDGPVRSVYGVCEISFLLIRKATLIIGWLFVTLF